MEYIEKILKKTGWSSLITSIVFAILGIILIVSPNATVTVISTILGTMFVIIGVYKIINYYRGKGKYNFYDYDMAYGIVAIILGVITIFYHNQIGTIFRILIGLWIIYSSVIRINLSLKLKYANSKMWIYSLIIAIIMLLCGIYITFNSGAIIVTIGVGILTYSILDIVEGIIFLKNLKKIA